MAKPSPEKHVSLSGVVVPSQWDASDRLVEVALFSPEDGELAVLPLGSGQIGRASCRERVFRTV